MAARSARSHREDSARARHGPSEASLKVLPAFSKAAGCGAQFAGGKRPAPTEPAGETRAPRPCPCPYWARSAQKKARETAKRFSRPVGQREGGSPGLGSKLSVCPLRHAKGMTLSPAGSGDAAQWAAPITDRRGSRDAGTAPAVTERAPHPKQKDTQQTLGVLLFFSVPCGCLTPLPRSSRRCPPPCRFECR